jgi:hypothetical protein
MKRKNDDKPKTFTRERSAKTGRYVKRGTNKKRPATTVVETAKRRDSTTVSKARR